MDANKENQKKTIMIIEDDFYVLDMYKTKFRKEGYNLIVADNGRIAIKKIEEGKINPDVILLDLVMPYVDGMTILKRIREKDYLKKIPIVLLTNLSQKENIKAGFEAGAQDYLIKSQFTPSEVMEKIKKFLV